MANAATGARRDGGEGGGHTGDAQLVKTGSVAWWGAGVTTSAPYIE